MLLAGMDLGTLDSTLKLPSGETLPEAEAQGTSVAGGAFTKNPLLISDEELQQPSSAAAPGGAAGQTHLSRWVSNHDAAAELACLFMENSMSEGVVEAAGLEEGATTTESAASACTEENYARDCGQCAALREAAPDVSLLPFHTRLLHAAPAAHVPSRMDWSRLAAVESTEALSEGAVRDAVPEPAPAVGRRQRFSKGTSVDVNSGGQVFFGLLRPPSGAADVQEEAVVIKFCNSRHMLQSEQMAAELAWHLGIVAPASRLLLKVHDTEEWWELAAAAEALSEALCDKLQKKQSMLLLQFAPGANLGKERDAWSPEHLTASTHALGRLLVLDLFLGNADRLPLRSLSWRGNPSNVLWSSHSGIGHLPEAGSGRRCIPIDAVVARRPPKALVEDLDHRAGKLLEMALLDRASAQQAILESVCCNEVATAALKADWAPNEKAWANKKGRASGASAPHSAVKAFHEGLRAALELALRERGLLEMVVSVLRGWLDAFHADMGRYATANKKLSETRKLADLAKEANKSEEVKERMSFWQSLLQEKSLALRRAADEWANQRGFSTVLSFRGFLGDSVINPVADAYELLVRLQQLVARARVLADAALATRPSDLAPVPLLVGPVTASCCLHLLRKLGVTAIINCTVDLPEPDPELLSPHPSIAWHRLSLADVEEQDLSAALEEGVRIIDEVAASGGRVLVHCHEGRSRSVSLCLAYMLLRERKPLGEALQFVKGKRPQARPNAGFMKQLLALELETLGSNSMSPEDLPKGKPQGFICEICGDAAGLTAEALALHFRQKHPDANAA